MSSCATGYALQKRPFDIQYQRQLKYLSMEATFYEAYDHCPE